MPLIIRFTRQNCHMSSSYPEGNFGGNQLLVYAPLRCAPLHTAAAAAKACVSLCIVALGCALSRGGPTIPQAKGLLLFFPLTHPHLVCELHPLKDLAADCPLLYISLAVTIFQGVIPNHWRVSTTNLVERALGLPRNLRVLPVRTINTLVWGINVKRFPFLQTCSASAVRQQHHPEALYSVLLDDSISLSPLYSHLTNDLHVSTATSLHPSFLWLRPMQA